MIVPPHLRLLGRYGWLALAIASGMALVCAAQDITRVDFSGLDLEELGNIRIISFSKREMDAFTTAENLTNHNLTFLPEALRLAAPVEAAFVNSRIYAVSIRGFNGLNSNKLLTMVDGRSLYSLRFTGTPWDNRDLALEEVSRIEIIAGPGGTTWGANAVNGIINIITKNARDSQGSLLRTGLGTYDPWYLYARQGWQTGEHSWMRLSLKGFERRASNSTTLAETYDGWSQWRPSLRWDALLGSQHELTVTADYFHARSQQFFSGRKDHGLANGGHLMARHSYTFDDDSTFHQQFYFDRYLRDYPNIYGQGSTWDYEINYKKDWHAHQLIFGGNYRFSDLQDRSITVDTPNGITTSFYTPETKLFQQYSLFVQDTIALPVLRSTLHGGFKAEYNDYSQWEWLPNLRLSCQPLRHLYLWMGGSSGVRIPSRGETESTTRTLDESGRSEIASGSPDLQAERLTTVEAGLRFSYQSSLSLSLNAFYNDYQNLILPLALPAADPLVSSSLYYNHGKLHSYGSECELRYNPSHHWRMTLSHAWLSLHPEADPRINPADSFLKIGSSSYSHQVKLAVDYDFSPEVSASMFAQYGSALQIRDTAIAPSGISMPPSPGKSLPPCAFS